jgi:hypothetical protein
MRQSNGVGLDGAGATSYDGKCSYRNFLQIEVFICLNQLTKS